MHAQIEGGDAENEMAVRAATKQAGAGPADKGKGHRAKPASRDMGTKENQAGSRAVQHSQLRGQRSLQLILLLIIIAVCLLLVLSLLQLPRLSGAAVGNELQQVTLAAVSVVGVDCGGGRRGAAGTSRWLSEGSSSWSKQTSRAPATPLLCGLPLATGRSEGRENMSAEVNQCMLCHAG